MTKKKCISIRTAKAALAAMDTAAGWIAAGEDGCGGTSWFTTVPTFDRRRRALAKAIAAAEEAR